MIAPVGGTPPGSRTAWKLSPEARTQLSQRTADLTAPAGRQRVILDWARARGRVSSSEVSSLTGLSGVSAGKILADIEDDGRLAFGRPNRTGRGFFYVPVG